jgi:hypothetical protein
LRFTKTPDNLDVRVFYTFDEKNIPKYFKKNIELNNLKTSDYTNMYVGFDDANMMKKL